MDNNNPANNVLLGAVISFIVTSASGLIIEMIRAKLHRDEGKNDMTISLKQELGIIQKFLINLKVSYEKIGYFELPILDSIQSDIHEINRSRGSFTLLRDRGLQERSMELITDIRSFTTSVRILENYYLTEKAQIWDKKMDKEPEIKEHRERLETNIITKRIESLAELRELITRIKEIQKNL